MTTRRICLCRVQLHDVDEHQPTTEAQLFRGYGIHVSPELDQAIARTRIPAEILEELAETERRLKVAR